MYVCIYRPAYAYYAIYNTTRRYGARAILLSTMLSARFRRTFFRALRPAVMPAAPLRSGCGPFPFLESGCRGTVHEICNLCLIVPPAGRSEIPTALDLWSSFDDDLRWCFGRSSSVCAITNRQLTRFRNAPLSSAGMRIRAYSQTRSAIRDTTFNNRHYRICLSPVRITRRLVTVRLINISLRVHV